MRRCRQPPEGALGAGALGLSRLYLIQGCGSILSGFVKRGCPDEGDGARRRWGRGWSARASAVRSPPSVAIPSSGTRLREWPNSRVPTGEALPMGTGRKGQLCLCSGGKFEVKV